MNAAERFRMASKIISEINEKREKKGNPCLTLAEETLVAYTVAATISEIRRWLN